MQPHPLRQRRLDDGLLQLLAVHRPQHDHAVLQGIGQAAVRQRVAHDVGAQRQQDGTVCAAAAAAAVGAAAVGAAGIQQQIHEDPALFRVVAQRVQLFELIQHQQQALAVVAAVVQQLRQRGLAAGQHPRQVGRGWIAVGTPAAIQPHVGQDSGRHRVERMAAQPHRANGPRGCLFGAAGAWLPARVPAQAVDQAGVQQRGLAAARWADQSDQRAALHRVHQLAGDGFAPEEVAGVRFTEGLEAAVGVGHGAAGHGHDRQRQTRVYALIERHGLRLRFDAQLGSQACPAQIILGQHGAALAGSGQGQHQLAVRRLAPGLQAELAPGIVLRQAEASCRQMVGSEHIQGFQDALVQALLLAALPPVESRAVVEGHARQERSRVQVGGPGPPLAAGAAKDQRAMGMAGGAVQQLLQADDVDGHHVQAGLQPDLVAAGVQPRLIAQGAQQLPQVGQRSGQAAARGAVVGIAPQQ